MLYLDLKSQIQRARAYYQISKPVVYSILLAPIVIIIFYTIYLTLPATRAAAIQSLDEYYPVEIITFVSMFLIGVYGINLGIGAIKRREPAYIAGFYILFALALLFIGLEEISWGQTFLRVDSPFKIEGRNVQGEFNFHNLSGLHGRSEILHVAFGVGGLVGIWLFARKILWKIAVPPILWTWFGLISVFSTLDLIQDYVYIYQKLNTYTNLLSEVIEMLIGVGGLLYVWLNFRLLAFGRIRGVPAAQSVRLDETDIWLKLEDGRRLVIPLAWFPQLAEMPYQEMGKFQLTKDNTWIRWPDIDLEVSVAQLVSGVPGLEYFD